MSSKTNALTPVMVKHGQTYTDYDNLALVEWCTPKYFGFQVCFSVTVEGKMVILTVTIKTPFGNYSKSFKFNSDLSWTWQPIGRAKVVISIGNFQDNGASISFDLTVKLCVKIPILGWKCISYTHHFVIPDNPADTDNISASDFHAVLKLQEMADS
ncbi:MAG: hypothetical protein AAFZ15_18975 [Bacteroidota bacterium]